jgi:hypothetical protein
LEPFKICDVGSNGKLIYVSVVLTLKAALKE